MALVQGECHGPRGPSKGHQPAGRAPPAAAEGESGVLTGPCLPPPLMASSPLSVSCPRKWPCVSVADGPLPAAPRGPTDTRAGAPTPDPGGQLHCGCSQTWPGCQGTCRWQLSQLLTRSWKWNLERRLLNFKSTKLKNLARVEQMHLPAPLPAPYLAPA